MNHDIKLHAVASVAPEDFPLHVDALIASLAREAQTAFTARGGSIFYGGQAMAEIYSAMTASAEVLKASAGQLMKEARGPVQAVAAVSVETLVASVVDTHMPAGPDMVPVAVSGSVRVLSAAPADLRNIFSHKVDQGLGRAYQSGHRVVILKGSRISEPAVVKLVGSYASGRKEMMAKSTLGADGFRYLSEDFTCGSFAAAASMLCGANRNDRGWIDAQMERPDPATGLSAAHRKRIASWISRRHGVFSPCGRGRFTVNGTHIVVPTQLSVVRKDKAIAFRISPEQFAFMKGSQFPVIALCLDQGVVSIDPGLIENVKGEGQSGILVALQPHLDGAKAVLWAGDLRLGDVAMLDAPL